MASMEARLSLEGAADSHSGVVKNQVEDLHHRAGKPRVLVAAAHQPVKKMSTSTTTAATAAATAANKAKQAAERLAAWQRRKNYDPLKAATNGKVQQVILTFSLFKLLSSFTLTL